jgi:cytochrome b
MIVLLLILLILMGLSGLAVYDTEEGAGPLGGVLAHSGHRWEEVFEKSHEFLANLTVVMIIIHILGVIMESLLHGENLAKAMWTGYKRAGQPHGEG